VRHDFKGRGELGRNELQKADKFWLRFSMIPIYNSENELSLGFYTKRCFGRERQQEKKRTTYQGTKKE
jgi:hypothetical protein